MTGALLEINGLSKRFGGVAAVADASCAVYGGTITALIGPNGAGKTTLFNVVSGFLRPDAGVIRFAGVRIDGLHAHAIARAGLVRSFQSPRILTRMTVLDNVMLAGRNQPGERLGAGFFAPRRVARREHEVRERALEMLSLVNLRPLAAAYAGTLSGGQRKLLELARALMTEPKMILLDEPMAGVAPALALELVDHIRRLRDRHRTTVFVVEHDMDIVMSISDRVIVMDYGRVIAEGTPEAVQHDERVIEAYLGGPLRPAETTGAAGRP
jgi:ABC-type branched-subunit amino acid transport system ATPase component